MPKQIKLLFLAVVALGLVIPGTSTAASTNLEVAGWIPYWRVTEGLRSAKREIDLLDTVYPFAYTVKNDGTLKDQADLDSSAWKKFFKTADREDVDIIPTIMWSDSTAMNIILSDTKKRADHIEEIVEMVEDGDYAGVDIDYEGKASATMDAFSTFLAELKDELDDKTLVCTIEARTPPESLYRTMPAILSYANDLPSIGRTCDVVQIMAYDQQRADIKLNDARKGTPYAPTADVDWVRKVLTLMTTSIPKEKIMLGIPTYGSEYEVTVSPNWYQSYRKLWSLNPEYGEKTAKQYKIKPSTNSAGEMSFSYIPKESKVKLSKSLRIPKNTASGNKVAAQALAQANKTGETLVFNYVSWSDAGAVEQKVKLAKDFGLRGVSIFKIDGGEDRDIWDIFDEK